MLVKLPADLGLCVRARRRQLKLAQAALARRAGVGRHWIVAFERGKANVDLTLVLRTIEALGLDLQVHAREVHAREVHARDLPRCRALGG